MNDSDTDICVKEETYNSSTTNSRQIEGNLLITETNVLILGSTEEKQNTSKIQNNNNKIDFYLGKKKDMEVNLGEGVVSQLTEKLKRTYCTVYFDNFFPISIDKLLQNVIYGVGAVRSNRKHMPKTKIDKK